MQTAARRQLGRRALGGGGGGSSRRQPLLLLARRPWLLVLLVLPALLWWQHRSLRHTLLGGTSAPTQQPPRPADGAQAASSSSSRWVQPQDVAAAARYLQDAVLSPRARAAVPRKHYTLQPEPFDMRQQHRKVTEYLASPAFAAKQAARRAKGERGIIINAGGAHLVTNAAVTLKVLREVLHCSLPVELVWHAPSEMDPQTLAALAARWGPIRGVDLSATPWPPHHRLPPVLARHQQPSAASQGSGSGSSDGGLPAERAAAKEAAFIRKVQSLAASSFASALLLDADNLPLADPTGLWHDASFKAAGALLWPDFWGPFTDAEKQDIACDMLGLQTNEAMALIAAGRGKLPSRGTESGQLLLDLAAHGDVAEWALWANSFGDSLYRALWGDKDTYALAFAVAGKPHAFNQLQVPPGGAFAWRARSLHIKATQATADGWQLAGMVQFDGLGEPAFLHRTMNKLSLHEQPWLLGSLTGPLPTSWLDYYLALESVGPTVGVPVTYAAPASAFAAWSLQPVELQPVEPQPQPPQEGSAQTPATLACPTAAFELYWQLRQHGVPVGANATLDAACLPHLLQQLGPQADAYKAAGLLQHPTLLGAAAPQLDAGLPGSSRLQPATSATSARSGAAAQGSAPVPAWMLPSDLARPPVATPVTRALAASRDALAWLREHAAEFPLLASPAA